MSQNTEPPVITTQPVPLITTQPVPLINNPEVLESESHELIGVNNGNDTQLDPAAQELEKQEELKRKAREQDDTIWCCEALTDCIEICIDTLGCSAGNCLFPCCSGDCCNDGCCSGDCCNDGCCGDGNNDGCCSGDGGNDGCCSGDGGNDDGCDPSCLDCCGGDGCCSD